MGIVEVMKLVNSIPTTTSGEVVEILVADGALAMHKRSASSFH
jgi:biotin carboxyl carrier protein